MLMKSLLNRNLLIALAGLVLAGFSAQAARGEWLTDYDKAVAKAKAENKSILLKFEGSDWCPPCIKLNKDVIATDAFQAEADESLVLLLADFPRKTKLPEEQQAHNDKLARKYGLEAFPTVLVLDAEGEVQGKLVGYPRGGLEGFMEFIKKNS